MEVEQSRQAQLDALVVMENKADVIGADRAFEWYNGLQDAINALGDFPNSHPFAPESANVAGLRQKLYGRWRDVYRIVFQVRHETVWVLRIRHAAQEELTPEEFGLPDDEETPC